MSILGIEPRYAPGPPVDVRRTSRRPMRLGLAGIVLAYLLGSGAIVAPWIIEPNRYAAVQSIERETYYRDPGLMATAWQLQVARRYRDGFEYQQNPSFCGPASIANLLRSVGRHMSQDAVIAATKYNPWFGILLGGLTLDQLGDVLRQSTGRTVTVMRDLSLVQFRNELVHVNDQDRRYIVNFHRGPLFGRGHGHFSPLLGYLPGADLVLVGDVNSAFRPYLVSSERLWRAMDTFDVATSRRRGLLAVRFD